MALISKHLLLIWYHHLRSVFEMQVIVAGLVEHFEFSLGTPNPIIVEKLGTLMYPGVKGEEDRGAQMPLFIRPIS